jgi:hypothetical protein
MLTLPLKPRRVAIRVLFVFWDSIGGRLGHPDL